MATDYRRHQESFGAPMAGSVMLHVCIVGAIALSAYLANRIHGNEWGNQQSPGAIQATLVSSAPTIPLPQTAPPTPNVLATEQPSQSPPPPQPVTIPEPEPEAIPIPVKKIPPPPKKVEKKQEQPPPPKHAQPTPQPNRAHFGEAAPTQMAHSMTPTQTQQNQPVNVTGGGQGFNYPYYVGIIQRKVREGWYTQEVDPRTQVGSRASVVFTIARDGSPSNVRISQSSGSPTLDSSAVRAVQRVESFGPLPPGYSGSSVSVEYTFSYDQQSH
jgi:periplasmic protein TonB